MEKWVPEPENLGSAARPALAWGSYTSLSVESMIHFMLKPNPTPVLLILLTFFFFPLIISCLSLACKYLQRKASSSF